MTNILNDKDLESSVKLSNPKPLPPDKGFYFARKPHPFALKPLNSNKTNYH